jgi:RND family efflux transporter MFP subunit
MTDHFMKIACLAATGLMLAGCGGEKPKAPREPQNVEVITIRPSHEIDQARLNGRVEAERIVDVSAEVAGQVVHIGVEEGQRVHNGDKPTLLMRLNDALMRADLIMAEAQLESDTLEVKRLEEALQRGQAKGLSVITERELQLARSKADVSRGQAMRAREMFDRTTIEAPNDGILDEIPVEVGTYVSDHQVVARIVDIDTVKVVIDVPQRTVQFLNVGDPVTVEYDYRGKTVRRDEKITFIAKTADPVAPGPAGPTAPAAAESPASRPFCRWRSTRASWPW